MNECVTSNILCFVFVFFLFVSNLNCAKEAHIRSVSTQGWQIMTCTHSIKVSFDLLYSASEEQEDGSLREKSRSSFCKASKDIVM